MFTKKSANIPVWGDTGRCPLILNALKLSVDYLDRLVASDKNLLIHKAYEEQRIRGLDWFKNINKIVEHYKNGPSNRTSTNVMRNMQMIFIDTWSNALADSPKLSFYKQLKTSMDCEEYLKIKDFSLRGSISQLRASAHCLLIKRL